MNVADEIAALVEIVVLHLDPIAGVFEHVGNFGREPAYGPAAADEIVMLEIEIAVRHRDRHCPGRDPTSLLPRAPAGAKASRVTGAPVERPSRCSTPVLFDRSRLWSRLHFLHKRGCGRTRRRK